MPKASKKNAPVSASIADTKSKVSKKSETADLVQHSIWGGYATKLKQLLSMGYSFGTYQGHLGIAGFYYHQGNYNLFPKEFRTPEDAVTTMVDYFINQNQK